MKQCFILLLCIVIISSETLAQKESETALPDSSQQNIANSITEFSDKTIAAINKSYNKLTASVEKQTMKVIAAMQKKEAALQKKLQGIDSSKAKELFAQTKEKYDALKKKIESPVDAATGKLKEYVPRLDSLGTALSFLQSKNISLPDLPADKLKQLGSLSSQLNELQGRLQQANEIQTFIREREVQLKSALQNVPVTKELLQLNKQVFYYQQQLAEYKNLLHEPDKLVAKALNFAQKFPAFQSFWQKNSYLAQLFPMPANYGTPQALAGLQTRTGVMQQIQQRMNLTPNISASTGGSMSPEQFMQQQIAGAQQQLNVLKDKLNKLGGGNSDMTMPDFKPNNQHTKKFLQRLEYGFNVQSERSKYLLPVTSDIALTVGYKLNDKSVIGIGASYKMGWGNGWNHLHLTSEGIGFRSYCDIKAKGSIWISGGWEYQYLQRFNNFSAIKNLDTWQRSGLLGLTKKYKIGKKDGKMQVLWDFMSYGQVPQGAAIKFRVGWNL